MKKRSDFNVYAVIVNMMKFILNDVILYIGYSPSSRIALQTCEI